MSREPISDRQSTAATESPREELLTGRRTLLGVGSGLLGLLAGCATLPGGRQPEEQSFSRFHLTAVYIAESVDLSLPEEVSTVGTADNADLVVLPDVPSVDAQQAVDWLAQGRVLALIGLDAEATWLGWAQSDPFKDAFAQGGYADGEPDPYLLVAAEIGPNVPTYRHSWGDTPRDRDLLRSLDRDLVDIEERTPP